MSDLVRQSVELTPCPFCSLYRYAANLVLGIRMFHLYIMVAYTLLHPRPVNAPPVLSLRFLAATSVSEFWSRRWHQMFRRWVDIRLFRTSMYHR